MEADIAWNTIADIYDTFVQTTFDVPFFLNEARQVHGPVLELMAGTGRVSLPLIEAGIELTCVDGAADMLARLEQKLEQRGLHATTCHADVRELALGQQFDLILLPFHSLAEIIDAHDRQRALARMYAHLSNSGRFICTFHNPVIRLQQATGQLQLGGRYALPNAAGTLVFWLIQQYDASAHILNVLEFFEVYDQTGLMQSRRLLEVRSVVLEQATVAAEFAQAGFKVQTLYGDYEYGAFESHSSPFMIWILGK